MTNGTHYIRIEPLSLSLPLNLPQSPCHFLIRGDHEQPEVNGIQLPERDPVLLLQFHAAQEDKEEL